MSAGEEDTELRDLVAQTLETKGVLGKIRAQLRSQVFLALEEQESTESRNLLINEELRSFTNTQQGRLASGLVREFLEFFGLSATLSVFDPETSANDCYDGRAALARELDIVDEDEPSRPLLADFLVAKRKDKHVKTQNRADLGQEQIDDAKEKFELYDKDCDGLIDKFEVQQLFCDVLPNFPLSMIDSYVNGEFQAANKGVTGTIDFKEFMEMYRRLFSLCKTVVSETDGAVATPALLTSRMGDGQSGPDKKPVSLADYMAPSKGIALDRTLEVDALSLSSHSSIRSGYSERSQRMRGVGKEDGFDDQLLKSTQPGLEFEHQLGDGGSGDDDDKVTKKKSSRKQELLPRNSLPPLSGAGGGKSPLSTLQGAPSLTRGGGGGGLVADLGLSLDGELKDLADFNRRLDLLGVDVNDDDDDLQQYDDDFNSTSQLPSVESVEAAEVAAGSDTSSLLNDFGAGLMTDDRSLSHLSNDDIDYIESIASN